MQSKLKSCFVIQSQLVHNEETQCAMQKCKNAMEKLLMYNAKTKLKLTCIRSADSILFISP